MAEYYFQKEGFPTLHIQCQGGQITAVDWVRTRRREQGQHGSAEERRLLRQVKQDLSRYFAGKVVAFDWPLQWPEATPFQRSVWRSLQTVPYGETRPYQWLAKEIGNERAVRAVGSANGANPFSLIVPCHRIVRKNGALGGYAAGTALKTRLLELEQQ